MTGVQTCALPISSNAEEKPSRRFRWGIIALLVLALALRLALAYEVRWYSPVYDQRRYLFLGNVIAQGGLLFDMWWPPLDRKSVA